MNAKQKMDVAMRRVENAATNLLAAGREYSKDPGVTAWRDSLLLLRAREYSDAIRSLHRAGKKASVNG